MSHAKISKAMVPIIFTGFLSASCGNHDPQISLKAYEGSLSKAPPEGTVRRGLEDYVLAKNGYPKEMKIDERFVKDGKILYENSCSVCHGFSGNGDGIANARGLLNVPSLHSDNLRIYSPKELFIIISEGKGRMVSYARRLTPKERWSVAAYVKTLQLSFAIPINELNEKDRKELP